MTKSSLYFWPILRVLCLARMFWISIPILFMVTCQFLSFFCCPTFVCKNKVTRGFHSTLELTGGTDWFCWQRFNYLIEYSKVNRTYRSDIQLKWAWLFLLDRSQKFKSRAGNTENEVLVKSKMKISSNLVAFSKNTNFKMKSGEMGREGWKSQEKNLWRHLWMTLIVLRGPF